VTASDNGAGGELKGLYQARSALENRFGAVHDAGLALGTMVTLGASPILVSAGGHLFLQERLTKRGTAAIAAALLGLLLLVAHPASGPRPVVGLMLALLSAVGYSAVTLHARPHRNVAVSAATGSAGALCLLPPALFRGIWPGAEHVAESTGWLIFLGAVPTLLAYGGYFAGLTTVRSQSCC